MGLFVLTGAGLCKTLYIGKHIRLDMTPQDIGIKGLCYYTYKTANLYTNRYTSKIDSVPVYIISSCTHIDLPFARHAQILADYDIWAEVAFEKNFLIPDLYCTDNRLVFLFLVVIL